MVAMTFAMPMALFPSMAENWGGAKSLGWLYSAMAMGFLASTVISGWTRKVERHGVAVIAGAAVWGIAIVALGFAPRILVGPAMPGAGWSGRQRQRDFPGNDLERNDSRRSAWPARRRRDDQLSQRSADRQCACRMGGLDCVESGLDCFGRRWCAL